MAATPIRGLSALLIVAAGSISLGVHRSQSCSSWMSPRSVSSREPPVTQDNAGKMRKIAS